MLRDVIELKQAALWHETTESTSNLISIRRDQINIWHSSRAHKITADFTFSILHIIVVRSGLIQMSGGACREQGSTDAGDSSMCGSNCASRLERASGSSRKISRRKGNFPVAPIPVADIPCSYTFYSPVMPDDSGRNSREEIAGSTGDKKSTPLGESGTTGCGSKGKNRNQEPSPTMTPATIDRDLEPSKRPPTGGWVMRISDCPHSYRTESVSRECIPGVDDVSCHAEPAGVERQARTTFR